MTSVGTRIVGTISRISICLIIPRQVGEIVFFLPRRMVFADKPSLLAGEMLLPLSDV
jgi:hypothetical protein